MNQWLQRSEMLVRVLVPLLLTQVFASVACLQGGGRRVVPPQWLLFGERCFAFYPVWSSWDTARSLCSLAGSSLVSLHSAEEKQFVGQLVKTSSPVWLGGRQAPQNGSWFWSDSSPFRISGLTNQRRGMTMRGGACLELEPKGGELLRSSCDELKFYICSVKANQDANPGNREQLVSDMVPGVSLFDIMWSYSHWMAEDVLYSSHFLNRLRSGNMTERCYTSFIQQEALYLHRVSSTLEALITRLEEADDIRLLLLDTLKHYSSSNQRLPPPFSPPWLHFALQSFHSVVLEEPVYWLVALSAQASLRNFLVEELDLRRGPQQVSGSVVNSIHLDWTENSLWAVNWTHRFKKVLQKHQHKMNEFKAIHIFREHMMNQKSFYIAADCDADRDV